MECILCTGLLQKETLEEDDLSLLTALLEENEAALPCHSEESNSLSLKDGEPDEFDELFDADGDGESYTEEADDGEEGKTENQEENVAALFGDVGDLTDDELPTSKVENKVPALSQGKTNQELQDELKKLQEQMKSLQEQLKAASIKQPPSAALLHESPGNEKKVRRIQESACFSAELDVPPLPRAKRVARMPKTPADSSLCCEKMGPLEAGCEQQIHEAAAAALERPRVSSTEMNRKMTGRKLIRLSQIKEKMATENLEETDWVTFGVILRKVTPQSANSGKTFSIWKLNDLRDLTRCVSLFLFGEVHKDLWKTEQGTVIGLLNANPMKPKEGSEEHDCEYCQYHIQAQYKKLSAKRSDLQSTFSGGRIPKKFRKGTSLKERLCQDGFYYGGVSSESFAASMAAAIAPKKKVQTTLTNLVVKGTNSIIQETKQKLDVSHNPWYMACVLDVMGNPKPAIQSISASALLKQQKQQMLEMRKRKSEEIEKRFLQSSSGVQSPAVPCSSRQSAAQSPRIGAEFPRLERTTAPRMPKLGRGISEAAVAKLRAKGQILAKADPNSIVRKQMDPHDVLEMKERAEKSSTVSPEDELEPARKKRREQLAYLESEEFQRILKAKSKHTDILKEAEAEAQNSYFEPLVRKEQMEEKMRSIREVKCRVVTCKTVRARQGLGLWAPFDKGAVGRIYFRLVSDIRSRSQFVTQFIDIEREVALLTVLWDSEIEIPKVNNRETMICTYFHLRSSPSFENNPAVFTEQEVTLLTVTSSVMDDRSSLLPVSSLQSHPFILHIVGRLEGSLILVLGEVTGMYPVMATEYMAMFPGFARGSWFPNHLFPDSRRKKHDTHF
ncbi:hypothetical protein A6R68_13052 [Neotoma lepida]|uniref:Replication factor Mcm10 C-terminal domain-containing protein n=1 Tax=Neotoma lepida TaxID=56216 RepID=A0A1A6H450_NEOLE|nr:hypothetical protein A6R68_13052 [Neotoma lepida]